MIFQQLSGINAVMFYAETIFEEAKFKVKRPLPCLDVLWVGGA